MFPDKVVKRFPELKTNCFLSGYVGSISHGTYSPKKGSIDDKDIMAIVIPDIETYFGLEQYGSRGTKSAFVDEYDVTIYEFLKFIRLLEKGNPNVLGLLWLHEGDYLYKFDLLASYLLKNRNLFASKKVYHSFTGYAYGQLHRMTHNACEGYMGAKRKQLVEKFHYDTKNASHLIRLLRMGIEFLNEGELHVKRKDSQQLLEIKRGEWTLDQVKSEAESLFKRAERAYDRSMLPPSPDRKKINDLTCCILHSYNGFC